VRELENIVRRALMSSHGIINLSDVQEAISQDTADPTSVPFVPRDQPIGAYISGVLEKVKEGELQDAHARVTLRIERELYSQAIQLAGGDQSKAARWLGVSRPTMREKLVRFGLLPAREDKTQSAA
jgi:DNA-binding NtrC family response regulator